ncbi:MAG TPA: hypothetical protein VFR93_07325 [Candidatus Limnocylindrales bacterium]|nr:hypothetical protein [Candidatus Limnocylindrales bacterium]
MSEEGLRRELVALLEGRGAHMTFEEAVVREVRLAGDHCAYHVGEFAALRQVMGTWPPSRAEA